MDYATNGLIGALLCLVGALMINHEVMFLGGGIWFMWFFADIKDNINTFR